MGEWEISPCFRRFLSGIVAAYPSQKTKPLLVPPGKRYFFACFSGKNHAK